MVIIFCVTGLFQGRFFMRNLKKSIFLTITFLLISCSSAFASELKSNNLNIRNVKNVVSNSSDLYHEKEPVVETINYSGKQYYLSEDDIYLMSQVVYAESKGEPYEGKVAVASVILNRVNDPKFPSSIEGVIKQKNAFSCVHNGQINVIPNEESRKAVIEAVHGYDPTTKAVFFYNPQTATCSWMKNVQKTNVKSIGHHVFFQVKY